jgi:RNA recognition motif-containing protein
VECFSCVHYFRIIVLRLAKLFVGNLPENTDSSSLRALISTHVNVQECDVLRNFAFVHVANESDADEAIKKFNKYQFMGRELHVERSTSTLRKQPGMSDKCFTCGAVEHKTSQCPRNKNRKRNNMNNSNDGGGQRTFKKPRQLLFDQPPLRRYPQHMNLAFPPTAQNNQKYFHPLFQQPPMLPQQQACWGYKMGNGNGIENDAELPCPYNPELQKLYEQYIDSRTRYFFYKEQLIKELRLQQQPQNEQLFNEHSSAVMRVDLTQFKKDVSDASQPPQDRSSPQFLDNNELTVSQTFQSQQLNAFVYYYLKTIFF